VTFTIHNCPVKHNLTQIIQAGLTGGNPEQAMKQLVNIQGSILRVGHRVYDLRHYDRLAAVGAGKASAHMAQALEQILGCRLWKGIVVTKSDHGCSTTTIQVQESHHPIPTLRGEQTARSLLAFIQTLTPHDLVFALISGGASSLLPIPAPGLTLADKQQTTKLLIGSGACITEINTVRKHLSAIKGGRLVTSTTASFISLLLSDVIDDDVSTIGSGLTAPDPTTFTDAKNILCFYRLWSKIPLPIRTHIQKGLSGKVPDSPKATLPCFNHVQHEIIGNNLKVVAAAASMARQKGYHPLILTTSLSGEAREIGTVIGSIVQEIHRWGRPVPRPVCVFLGGEPTVTLNRHGKGGRAQELALSVALHIGGIPNVWVAALGTDGTDGPTNVAGAVVSGETISHANRLGVDPVRDLANHNSFPFFQKVGGHIITGPTGTTLNDLYMILAP